MLQLSGVDGSGDKMNITCVPYGIDRSNRLSIEVCSDISTMSGGWTIELTPVQAKQLRDYIDTEILTRRHCIPSQSYTGYKENDDE